MFYLLDALSKRTITGHDAIQYTKGYIAGMEDWQKDLVFCILDKNLKTRTGADLINKAIPKCVPTFKVALANSYDKQKGKVDFNKQTWFASQKLDGVRCLAIVDENGECNFYSRQGKTFDTLDTLRKEIESLGFNVVGHDFNRPWGGFLLIDESQSKEFITKFISNEELKIKNKVSPKILIVNPNSRLSWQYHYRRKEIWKVFKNDVGVIKSNDNNETEMKIFKVGDVINLEKGERHRLIGLSDFGIVAEIWIHTDPTNPSDENDIVRLQDDYSRD